MRQHPTKNDLHLKNNVIPASKNSANEDPNGSKEATQKKTLRRLIGAIISSFDFFSNFDNYSLQERQRCGASFWFKGAACQRS